MNQGKSGTSSLTAHLKKIFAVSEICFPVRAVIPWCVMEAITSNTIKDSAVESTFLTAAQLQRRWGVSSMFLVRARKKGQIRVHKFGPGAVRYALSDVQKFEKEAAA